ncbi:MAG TPA: cytochrome b [Steroidobacteraceae bacterium]|nr:cytochrome b [Steroidobacteraceae bacterium]HNS26714.1 cytochrome b [Steroidobacteraceae bacterium]
MLRNSNERYGTLSVSLHWLMLLLIAAVYACIELRVNFPRGSDTREALKNWHFMLGLGVLLLALVRLAVHLWGPKPRIQPDPGRLQDLASRVGHFALYVLMLGMPLAGWLILSAEGDPIPFFGLQLPPLLAPNEALAKDIEEIHATAGTVGYWLIGLHAAAALFHHYVQRDNTLTRMLPLWRRGA